MKRSSITKCHSYLHTDTTKATEQGAMWHYCSFVRSLAVHCQRDVQHLAQHRCRLYNSQMAPTWCTTCSHENQSAHDIVIMKINEIQNASSRTDRYCAEIKRETVIRTHLHTQLHSMVKQERSPPVSGQPVGSIGIPTCKHVMTAKTVKPQ